MIRLILVFLTLAKTAPNFIGFPRCKNSIFFASSPNKQQIIFLLRRKSGNREMAQIGKQPHNE